MAKRGRRKGSPIADKAEVARRIAAVEDMLAAREPSRVIEAKFSAPPPTGWGVNPRTVRIYIEQARRAWAREADPPKEVRRASIRRSADLLFRRGVADGKLSAAAMALRMTAALDGVATDRVEHSGPGGGAIPVSVTHRLDLSALTDEELDAFDRIARKLEAARAGGAKPVLPRSDGDEGGGAGGEGAPVG